MTTKIYIPIGLPASGKSTYYENNLDKNTVMRINRDSINDMISGGLFTNNISRLIKLIENSSIELALAQDFSIYIDRTNLTPKVRKRFINQVKDLHPRLYIVALYFEPDLSESLNRNKKRDDKTLAQIEGIEEWMPEAMQQITAPEFSEGFDEIITLDYNGNKTKLETIRELAEEDSNSI